MTDDIRKVSVWIATGCLVWLVAAVLFVLSVLLYRLMF